jgi:hypothetical protein
MHSRTPWPRHFSLSSIKQVVSSNTADLKTTRFKSGGRLTGTGTYMYAHDCLQQRFASQTRLQIDAPVKPSMQCC